MNYVKYLISVMLGALLAYFKLYGFAFTLVGAAVMMDLITGVLAAVISGDGLSGEKGLRGVLKKLSLFAALLFGTFLDLFVPYATAQAHIELGKGMLFSSVICVYIVVTESVSVIENILRCNGSALPEWMAKAFTAARGELDKGGKDNDKSSGVR